MGTADHASALASATRKTKAVSLLRSVEQDEEEAMQEVAEVVGALPNYLEGYTTVGENRTDEDFDPTEGLGKSAAGRSRCQLLLMESFASTKYGPLWILGIPFFRRYYTTFRIGESHKDRTLFMAPSTEDCYPEGSDSSKASLLDVGSRDTYMRTINASRIHVPELARKALKSSFVRL